MTQHTSLSFHLQVGEELNHLVYELEKISSVRVRSNMCILSLICNVERTSEILLRTFKVLLEEGINVSMMSQGASKVCDACCLMHTGVACVTCIMGQHRLSWGCGVGTKGLTHTSYVEALVAIEMVAVKDCMHSSSMLFTSDKVYISTNVLCMRH